MDRELAPAVRRMATIPAESSASMSCNDECSGVNSVAPPRTLLAARHHFSFRVFCSNWFLSTKTSMSRSMVGQSRQANRRGAPNQLLTKFPGSTSTFNLLFD
jgi:hypothetical protein